jgi:hypothetical protein
MLLKESKILKLFRGFTQAAAIMLISLISGNQRLVLG